MGSIDESCFINTKAHRIIALVVLFGLGLGVRLLDLTDPPMDFHGTRQLRAATIARRMDYQMLPEMDVTKREQAISLWKFEDIHEPQIFERIVATIRLGTVSIY